MDLFGTAEGGLGRRVVPLFARQKDLEVWRSEV